MKIESSPGRQHEKVSHRPLALPTGFSWPIVCDVNYALRSIVFFEKSGQLCMANNAKPNCFETENACALKI